MRTTKDGQPFTAPKQVRENTFFTLLGPEERISAERMADRLGEAFRESHFEKKWFSEYYFEPNNRAFLEHLAEFDDTPGKIYAVLEHQLYEYVERTPVQPRWGQDVDLANLYNQWLEHTEFICRREYNKTQNEVFAVAVRWVVKKIEDRERHAKWVKERKREAIEKKEAEQKSLISKDGTSEKELGHSANPEPVTIRSGFMGGKQYTNFSKRFKEGHEEKCLQPVTEIAAPDKSEVSQKENKPTLRQIAYIYRYNGEPINELNASEIAKEYGHYGDTSGWKLLNEHYIDLAEEDQRVDSKQAVKNIRAAMKYLTGLARTAAEQELQKAEGKKQ